MINNNRLYKKSLPKGIILMIIVFAIILVPIGCDKKNNGISDKSDTNVTPIVTVSDSKDNTKDNITDKPADDDASDEAAVNTGSINNPQPLTLLMPKAHT